MTRKITPEEKKLWKLATLEVEISLPPSASTDAPIGMLKADSAPASPENLDDFFQESPKIKMRITPLEEMLPLPKKKVTPVKELIGGTRNAMDAKGFERLKKGKVKIDARIDLHGMWLMDAQIAVRQFLEMSHASAKRCVLVITGKGGITGDGKIRGELPKWLNDPDIRTYILSFTQAAPEHGGAGAFYVYLRK